MTAGCQALRITRPCDTADILKKHSNQLPNTY